MEILEHPMAWRWTEEKHAQLHKNVLSQMHPLKALEAKNLWERTSQLLSCDSLAEEEFGEIVSLDTSSVIFEKARDWMNCLQPDRAITVRISWDQNTAISTTWNIFTRYWNTMCYPASDDVVILPSSADWVLFYYHEETLHFGRRTK